MKRPNRLAMLLLVLLALCLPACAPSSAMIATLTMLPGTPTATRIIRLATPTPRPTNTLAPVNNQLATKTPIPPEDCPAGIYDSAAPGDPSQLAGRSYDLQNLPAGYQLEASGSLVEGETAWAAVRWEGRSLYWIQHLVCRDARRNPRWEIIDALALPRLDPQSGEALTPLCAYGMRRLPNAVAYGIYDPDQPAEIVDGETRGWPVQVQAAWEMTDSFVPLDLRGLTCYFTDS